jgi:hypothetical protein
MRTSREILRDTFTLPLAEALRMPREPCLGSGTCCREAVCMEGQRVGHGPHGPCPELREHDGRSWCGLVEDATGQELERLRESLAIGAGCCMTLNEQRDELVLKLRRKA